MSRQVRARRAVRREGVSILELPEMFPDDEVAEEWSHPGALARRACAAVIAVATGCRCRLIARCGGVTVSAVGSLPSKRAL